MTFKQDWEKTEQQVLLPNTTIKAMLKLAVPNKKLFSYSIISGGCANLNVKIILEEEDLPFILRVYLRDKDAAYLEQALGILLNQFLYHKSILLVIMKSIALRLQSLSPELH